MTNRKLLYNFMTYHMEGLPFEQGAECVMTETARDLYFSCNGEEIVIPRKAVTDTYILVEQKRVQTNEVDPLRTILHTMFLGKRAMADDSGPRKRIDKYKFEDLVILSRERGRPLEVRLRISPENWEKAENFADSFFQDQTP